MGKIRDRVASGLKAKATNQLKSPNYYPETGGLGGKAVKATKRAFAAIPGLASRAAKKRFEPRPNEHKVEYIVRSMADVFIGTFNSRAAARTEKRLQKQDKGIVTYIVRYKYDTNRFEGGYIVEDRKRADELSRLSVIDSSVVAELIR